VASRWAFQTLHHARPSTSVPKVVWTCARMAMPSTTGTRLLPAVRGPLSSSRAKAVLGAVAVRIGNAAVVWLQGTFLLLNVVVGALQAGASTRTTSASRLNPDLSLQSCRGLHCSRFRLR
jgi:hypothetical protein